VFGDTAVIIDGIAPYRWLNPHAPANWLAWREDLGLSDEHLSDEIGFWNVERAFAYAVISGTLTVTIKSQSISCCRLTEGEDVWSAFESGAFNVGTLFKMNAAGTLSTIRHFAQHDGVFRLPR
jgi:hypothetical protein